MKKRDLQKVALLGITSGLLLAQQASAESENHSSAPASKAKNGCKGKNGCPGVASTESPKPEHGCPGAVASKKLNSCHGKQGCPGIASKDQPKKEHGCSSCGSVASRDLQKKEGGCGGKGRCGGLNDKEVPAKKTEHECKGKNGCPGALSARELPKKEQGCGGRCGGKLVAENDSSEKHGEYNADDANDSNLGYHLMTEDELLLELNDEGAKMYQSLDPKGKELALEVASMRCAGTNPCGKLNACKTEKNDCAGKGSCKGTGKCAVSDKNLAVKLVYEKMKNKRSNLDK
jgi:hypothetical protein